MDIIIDNEFKNLIPPLSKDEFKQLEKNILADGIRDPLIVWNNILIDGHNRYQIAKKHGLLYQTQDMEFEDRDHAMVWIIDNQLGRRNLNSYNRSTLVLKEKDALHEIANKNRKVFHGNQHTGAIRQNSDKKQHDVKKELANLNTLDYYSVVRSKYINLANCNLEEVLKALYNNAIKSSDSDKVRINKIINQIKKQPNYNQMAFKFDEVNSEYEILPEASQDELIKMVNSLVS